MTPGIYYYLGVPVQAGPGHLDLSLLQSSFLPFPLVDSPGVWAAAKHFDVIYTLKQPYTVF